MLVVTALNWRDMREVLQTGTTTSATIVDRFSSGGRSRSYYLVYRYSVPPGGVANSYTRRQSVGSNRYFDLRYLPGATAQIRYLPTNPTSALLADTALPTETLLLWFTGTALCLSGLLVGLHFAWQDWRLARRGQLLAGIVQAVEPWPWKENRYQLRYRFVDPSGTWREGRARIAAAQAGSGRFAPGTTVAVLYADRELFCLL
jgi:hypothetical protein